MPHAIHRTNGAQPDVITPPLVLATRAKPHIPPSKPPTPSRRDALIFSVNEDYKLLFQILFQAIDLFDRCDDCETLLDAGKLFQYITEMAEDAAEEAWEKS